MRSASPCVFITLASLASCARTPAPVAEDTVPPRVEAPSATEAPANDEEAEILALSAAHLDSRHITAEEYASCVAEGDCPAASPDGEAPLRVPQTAAFRYCRHIGKALPSAVLTRVDLVPSKDMDLGPREWSRYRGYPWLEDWKRDSGVPKWELEYRDQFLRSRKSPGVAYALRCATGAEVPCVAELVEEPKSEALSFRCASGDVSLAELRTRVEAHLVNVQERLEIPESLRPSAEEWVKQTLKTLRHEGRAAALLDPDADAR